MQNRNSKRIFGMTQSQFLILMVITCFACLALGSLAGVIAYDTYLKANLIPVQVNNVVPTIIPQPTLTIDLSSPIPLPSSTPSIYTGEPLDYLPEFPEYFEVNETFENINTTLDDGSKWFTLGFTNKNAAAKGDIVVLIYYIFLYPTEAKAKAFFGENLNLLAANENSSLGKDINFEIADETAVYLHREDADILQGKLVSRVNNIIITTEALTAYNPEIVSESFLEYFVAKIEELHMLGLLKLANK